MNTIDIENPQAEISNLVALIDKLKQDLSDSAVPYNEKESRLEEVEAIARQLQLKYGTK